MNDERDDFERFLQARHRAGEAYVSGDFAPLGALVARGVPASFFGPDGGRVQGAAPVRERYERDAGNFRAGSTSTFEVLQHGASGDVGYQVALQRATAHLAGRAEPVPMVLRVTEIFRREGGQWKLVHRHADAFKEQVGAPDANRERS